MSGVVGGFFGFFVGLVPAAVVEGVAWVCQKVEKEPDEEEEETG